MKATSKISSGQAWLFPGSIRANILFGEAFDSDRYWKVIHACALAHDLKQWENSEQSFVKEGKSLNS